jgi:hypothetical protein
MPIPDSGVAAIVRFQGHYCAIVFFIRTRYRSDVNEKAGRQLLNPFSIRCGEGGGESSGKELPMTLKHIIVIVFNGYVNLHFKFTRFGTPKTILSGLPHNGASPVQRRTSRKNVLFGIGRNGSAVDVHSAGMLLGCDNSAREIIHTENQVKIFPIN